MCVSVRACVRLLCVSVCVFVCMCMCVSVCARAHDVCVLHVYVRAMR